MLSTAVFLLSLSRRRRIPKSNAKNSVIRFVFICDTDLWHSVVSCHVASTCLFLKCSENSGHLYSLRTVRFLARISDAVA